MGTTITSQLSPAELAVALEGEPLISVTAASRLLGIPSPNFKRDALPHLTAIPVEGTASVYFRSEVLELVQRRGEGQTVPPARDGRGRFLRKDENGNG